MNCDVRTSCESGSQMTNGSNWMRQRAIQRPRGHEKFYCGLQNVKQRISFASSRHRVETIRPNRIDLVERLNVNAKTSLTLYGHSTTLTQNDSVIGCPILHWILHVEKFRIVRGPCDYDSHGLHSFKSFKISSQHLFTYS